VKAVNGSIESEWSEVWSFLTEDCSEDPLNAPTLISPANNTDDENVEQIAFQWSDVNSATNYTSEISLDDSFESLFFTSTTNSTSQIVASFTCETLYYWRVKANNDGTSSEWSDTWSFTTTSCTGVGLIYSNTVTLYPNPANDYIMLDYSNEYNKQMELKIFSINGALVYSHRATKNKRISIKSLSAGIYIIQLIHNRTLVGSVKFVKE